MRWLIRPGKASLIIQLYYYHYHKPHSLWDRSSPTRDWTQPLVVKVLTPNHWTSREFPNYHFHKQGRRALSNESINTTFNFCIKMVFSSFLQSCRAWGWVKGGKERESEPNISWLVSLLPCLSYGFFVANPFFSHIE